MELVVSETNKGKKSLLFDGYTFRFISVLKNSEISWRCTKNNCSCRLRTDAECKVIVKCTSEHNHPSDDRKLERQQVRIQLKRKASDISARPSKVIRQTLQEIEEHTLLPSDLKSLSQSLYRTRRKNYPALPKNRMETHECLKDITIETNKGEQFLAHNDAESGIIIFTCNSNLQCMCDVDDVFIDGTFKCAPKYFYQLYSIHGCKNGNYVPLLFALLPSKDGPLYTKFWTSVFKLCSDQSMCFKPKTINVDFELAMINSLRTLFPESDIKGCRFHLGQAWFRKIQALGLASDYKDRSSELSKWMSQFFGMPYLPANEIEDSFAEEIMSDAPNNDRCSKFSDYILENYVSEESKFPPTMWAAKPDPLFKRTNNGPEAFHSHYNGQFYSSHPSIYTFIDVLKQIQTTTYIKIRGIETPAIQRRNEKEKLEFALQQYAKLETGTINRSTYLKSMGLRFSARTDL